MRKKVYLLILINIILVPLYLWISSFFNEKNVNSFDSYFEIIFIEFLILIATIKKINYWFYGAIEIIVILFQFLVVYLTSKNVQIPPDIYFAPTITMIAVPIILIFRMILQKRRNKK